MIALVQRVNHASVTVDEKKVSHIAAGMLVFVGVEKHDTEDNAIALAEKLHKFRIFSDNDGRTNQSIEQIGGEVLLVPQFTLPADTRKGNRPGFDPVAPPEIGRQLFDLCVSHFIKISSVYVATGVFQTDMKVLLENDGPMTFWLQK